MLETDTQELTFYAYAIFDAEDRLLGDRPHRFAAVAWTPQQVADLLVGGYGVPVTVYVWRDPSVVPQPRLDLNTVPDARASTVR